MPRLRRTQLAGPGISRRARGRGFSYIGRGGEAVRNSDLDRIKSLAIPPAWREVWICPYENGHIQACGLDQAGRRQYLYHPSWTEQRSKDKDRRVLRLAEALPKARDSAEARLESESLDRDTVLAASFRLLDLGFFRIGSEQYAKRNGTYGLATLRREDVRVRGDAVHFEFTGKHRIHVSRRIVDPQLASLLKRLLARRDTENPELLAWRESRTWQDVRSADINEYLRTLLAGDFSAKDFRSWHGTVLAAAALSLVSTTGQSITSVSKTKRNQMIAHAAREVGHYLGNTPAVARSSYIHHGIVANFHKGRVIDVSLLDEGAIAGSPATHGPVESETLRLLTKVRR